MFTSLTAGPSGAATLFGPRRTGKTQFLLRDIAPYAAKRRHKVVYASFWQSMDHPVGVLLYELDQALRGGSAFSRGMDAAKRLAPKFKVQDPSGLGSVELDLGKLKGAPSSDHLIMIDQFLGRLSNDKRPTLLLLDEFQELAKNKDNKALIAGLRTSLDKRATGLATIFTGSSQEGLRQVFSTRSAPFFGFATPLKLPDLGSGFVESQLETFGNVYKRNVTRAKALEVFEQFENNPLFFNAWLTTLGLYPGLNYREATAQTEEQIALELGFDQSWLDMNALQRLLCRLLAEGVQQPFGEEGATRLRAITGNEPASAAKRQTALNGLIKNLLVDKWGSEYRLSDPLFRKWVKDRPESHF